LPEEAKYPFLTGKYSLAFRTILPSNVTVHAIAMSHAILM